MDRTVKLVAMLELQPSLKLGSKKFHFFLADNSSYFRPQERTSSFQFCSTTNHRATGNDNNYTKAQNVDHGTHRLGYKLSRIQICFFDELGITSEKTVRFLKSQNFSKILFKIPQRNKCPKNSPVQN